MNRRAFFAALGAMGIGAAGKAEAKRVEPASRGQQWQTDTVSVRFYEVGRHSFTPTAVTFNDDMVTPKGSVLRGSLKIPGEAYGNPIGTAAKCRT